MYDKTIPVITLDGPSGTGKGTLCHLLAKRLGWNMLDSGAIYRVLAFAARKKELALNDVASLTALAQTLNLYFQPSDNGSSQAILDGENVSEAIRSEQSGQDASQVAALPEIREALLERQRRFAQAPGLVTDGRDMGTVVFPNAFLKIFLHATQEERANRRYLQLKNSQINVSLAQVVEELAKRDARDMERAHAPLRPAADAVAIDTTQLTVIQTFEKVLELVEERLKMVF